MNLAEFVEELESATTNVDAEVVIDDHGSFRSVKHIIGDNDGKSDRVVIVLEPHDE